MEMERNRIASPLGEMLLVTDPQGTVWSLGFGGELRERVGETSSSNGAPSRAARTVIDKLAAYFDGDLDALADIPVADKGDELQRRVWAALRKIPAGTTTTYGELAVSLGFTDPRMAREVGGAVGANPVALIVPCHRVIGKDGSLRGYRWGLERKRELLEREIGSRGFELESQRAGA